MKSKPLFSILVANYNNGHYITEAIESVFKQTYNNFEIIIVDDCSTDNSIKVITNLINLDKRIKLYINEKNNGCGYTKRKCVEVASGDIVGFLDPDDALVENAIEVSVNSHLSNPKASLIYSNCYMCDSELRIKSARKVNGINPNKTFLDSISDKGVYVSHFTTFKKSLYLKTEGIDPFCLRAVDQDLYFKMEEVGDLHHISNILYKYRIYDGGISLGKNTLKATSWMFYVIMKTCKRRNLKFEDYIPSFLQNEIEYKLMARREYRTGKFVLKPLRFLKKMILNIK